MRKRLLLPRRRVARTLPAAFLLLFPFGAEAVNLSSLTMKPTTVANGLSSVGTVTLSAAAPSGGATVILTNHKPEAAEAPPWVTVPEGATSTFFVVTTSAVASSTAVVIDASYAGVTRSATLTVTPREPIRGVEGDLWADLILGKPDFSEITPNEVVPYKVFNPGGVFVDRSVIPASPAGPGRAYVWDSSNSRILGIDLATCYGGVSPCSAQIVIGQPSGSDHSACNGDSAFQRYPTRAPSSAATLCGSPEVALSPLEWKSFVTMAADPQGNLFVPDAFNNRVLKYTSPFTTDVIADQVWGQADFSGNLCNRGASPTASTLCFTVGSFSAGGVALDSAGNLWVADNGNNRVLRFPKNVQTGAIAATADLVLGQPDFVSRGAGTGPAAMWSPASLRFGPDGRLYVADTDNNRLLVFSPTFANGMAAAVFGSQFRAPYGLEADPAGDGLWVNDSGNNMIELWDWNGTTVKKVLGKDSYQPDGHCQEWLCVSGGGIGLDAEGSVLPSIFVYVQDVVRFRAPIPTPKPGAVYQPDKRFFDPPDGYNLRGNKGLRSGSGVAIFGDQLLVADAGRVVFWNGLDTLTNGKAFDGFAGSPDFGYQFNCCGYLKSDSAGRLWVQAYTEGIHAYQLPLTSGQTPLATILTPGSSLPVLGGGSLTLGSFTDGLVPSPDATSLWVSDTFNHRVLRVRDPLTAPLVDVVLGQTDTAGTLCNRGLVPPPNTLTNLVADATMLCHPGALSFDRLGNLFVSDHGPEVEGNWRLLRFAGSLFPSGITAPLFDVPATKIFPFLSGQPGITFEPAFDSANRMVVGYNPYKGGNFVGVYNDPAGPSTDPDTYLNDFGSWPAAVAFDANDNLYVGDSNRSRLLIYRHPLCSSLPTLITAPSAVCPGTSGYSASVPDAGSGATYTWTITNGTITAGAGTKAITWRSGTASPVTVNVTVKTGAVCSATISKSVTNVTPSAVITAPSAVCPNTPGHTASIPDAGPGASYTWTLTNGTITAGAGTRSITWSSGSASPVTLKVTAVNAAGCSATGSKSVINTAPSAAITASSGVCANSTGNAASVLAAGTGATYTWTISNGTITLGQGTRSIQFTAAASGSVLLNVTVVNATGCGASGSKSVPINPIPSSTITAPSTVCASASGYTASVADAGSGATYAWRITNGTITGGAGTRSITWSSGAASPVTLKVTVKSGAACSSTGSMSVTSTAPSAVITAPSAVCPNASGYTASVPDAGPGATYTWTLTNGTITAGAGTRSITWSSGAASPVTLAVTVRDGAGCSATASKSATNTSPSAVITAPSAVCGDSAGNAASVPSAGTGATYTWAIANGTITSGQGTRAIQFTAAASGSVTLSVTVVNATGCDADGSKTTPINPTPSSTITAPSSVCHGSTGNAASAPPGGGAYAWTVTNGTLTSGQGTANIIFTAGATGSVTLKVTVGSACKSTSSKPVPINTGC